MISRTHRFHGHNSLNHVYRAGKVVRSEFLALRFADSRKPDYRLAVVVSKKVSKSAVKRNRIRRRIYEIVRVQKKQVSEQWPSDMIISVFDERIATMQPGELQDNVTGLLKKAGILSY